MEKKYKVFEQLKRDDFVYFIRPDNNMFSAIVQNTEPITDNWMKIYTNRQDFCVPCEHPFYDNTYGYVTPNFELVKEKVEEMAKAVHLNLIKITRHESKYNIY